MDNKEKEQGLERSEKINNVISFMVMKKLITPINKTKAFKLGLVDGDGIIIKEPKTDKEKLSLSIFDKFIFKLKRIMGSKLAQLNTFMYLQATNIDFFDNINILGGVERRGVVKKVQKDMEKLFEKYNMSEDEFLKESLLCEIKNKETEQL